MNIKEILEYWKLILGIIVIVGTSTYGIFAWAEDQKQLIRAEQSLIHSKLYQESRVQMKRDQISDNLKMIRLIENNDELTEQEQKFVDSLTQENIRLLQDIEKIEAQLHSSDIN